MICLQAPFRAEASISPEAKNISSGKFTPVLALGLAVDHREMSPHRDSSFQGSAHSRWRCRREKNVSLNSLTVPGWVWKLKRQRLIEEKQSNFIEFLHVQGSHHKSIKTWRSDQSRKFLCLWDKEMINVWRINKTEGFRPGITNGEVSKKIRVSLTTFAYTYFWALNSLSVAIKTFVLLPLATRNLPFPWRVCLLLSGKKGKQGWEEVILTFLLLLCS